jgi:hypothetical protein
MGDTSIKFEVGKTYKVKHCRKGVFTAKVLQINGEWVDMLVVAGSTHAILPENKRSVGEPLTARESFMNVIEVVS